MTTVVADVASRKMASDSKIEHGDTVFKSKKIFQLNGELIGVSGDFSDAMKFVGWYVSGCDPEDHPDLGKDGFDALVLDKSGTLRLWDQDMVPLTIDEPFYAIGSGAKAAMGAMHCGASPEQAILVAAKVDAHTDSNVAIEVLDLRRSSADELFPDE